MNRQHFAIPFSQSAMPTWRCPNCHDGVLAGVKSSLKLYETSDSKAARDNPDWDHDWESQRFFLQLQCIKCSEPVLWVGDTQSVEEHDEEFGWVFSRALVPTYFEPAIPLIQVPKACPDEVHSEVLAAAALYWSAPASSGNRIRACVERLMDAQAVASGTSLHARIQAFASKNKDISDALLAIKWIGNTGSHSDELEASDVLDAFELLEYALEELYEGRTARLRALAGSINLHKGPAPK